MYSLIHEKSSLQPLGKLLDTNAPGATILIRILIGGVFLSEGIQKFMFPQALGEGRFIKIGIPEPQIMGPFVAGIEVFCGLLLLFGFLTRIAAIILLANISVALISTKVPILLGYGFWVFQLPKVANYGFWSMLHEARTDFSMFIGSLFLIIVGAGSLSLDSRLSALIRRAIVTWRASEHRGETGSRNE